MQCKLVETSRSSALIETAGDCCVVSECHNNYVSNDALNEYI